MLINSVGIDYWVEPGPWSEAKQIFLPFVRSLDLYNFTRHAQRTGCHCLYNYNEVNLNTGAFKLQKWHKNP